MEPTTDFLQSVTLLSHSTVFAPAVSNGSLQSLPTVPPKPGTPTLPLVHSQHLIAVLTANPATTNKIHPISGNYSFVTHIVHMALPVNKMLLIVCNKCFVTTSCTGVNVFYKKGKDVISVKLQQKLVTVDENLPAKRRTRVMILLMLSE